MTTENILKLAEQHGLNLTDDLSFNEMGIDFKVVFATALDGKKWVLRVPRRKNLEPQIEKEKNILNLVKRHLSIAVPDWQIVSPAFIAYPLLEDKPVLTFDAETYEVTWNMDKESPLFVPDLAKILAELHRIPAKEAQGAKLKILTSDKLRAEIYDRLTIVKTELGISKELEERYNKWLDNDLLWPDFTSFIHGDLYAGHILASTSGEISGIIDWSEAQVNDPSIDFAGHATVFGEESLKQLIQEYEMAGGKVWNKLFEQAIERQAAAPLNYGIFAIQNKSDTHIKGAKTQLGVV